MKPFTKLHCQHPAHRNTIYISFYRSILFILSAFVILYVRSIQQSNNSCWFPCAITLSRTRKVISLEPSFASKTNSHLMPSQLTHSSVVLGPLKLPKLSTTPSTFLKIGFRKAPAKPPVPLANVSWWQRKTRTLPSKPEWPRLREI